MGLVLRGARVVDPGRGIDTPLDVRIEGGLIAAVGAAPGAPLEQPGDRVRDVRGAVLTPGLIDGHVHVYEGVGNSGIDPDIIGVGSAVTTVIDAGSSGAATFEGMRRYVMARAKTRVLCLLSIATIGSPGGPHFQGLSDPRWIDEDRTAQVLEANRDRILGIKVKAARTAVGDYGLEPLRRACALGRRLNVPVMCHIGDPHEHPNPILIEDVLPIMRPGDIVTHVFTGHAGGLVDEEGRIRPVVREGYASGLRFDVGHGLYNMSFPTAARVLDADLQPHTISTDVHRLARRRLVFDLPTTMAKFLALGFSLPAVVEKATYETARSFGRPDLVSGVAVGQPADLSVFRLEDAEWRAEDSMGGEIVARQRIVPVLSVRGDEVFEAAAAPVE